MNSFRSLDDKYAKLVVDSIKEYIQDFNKEKEFKEGNSKKIVVFGRSSGKNMAVMRELLKDLGLSKEAIRKEHILSYHYYLNDREFEAALKGKEEN